MTDPITLATDQALVRDVLAARAGAFERLVKTYQGLCWHVIVRMVRHPEDARELCQEAFLRVYQCIDQYRGDSALKSWIAQVAYSVAKRHLERRRIPLADVPLEDDGLSTADTVADSVDLERTHGDGEIAALLHAAIAALAPLPRTVLTLYHLEEMSITEIAAITGVAQGTIKSHLFRSRRQLRATLERDMGAAA
ncbi:MAG: sigma-70 family RNA polymerase sigma factor [Dokdonella sp.]